jgi:hypothetical protein
MRPVAQQSIEASLTARQAAVEHEWQSPELDVTLLRSELAACRDEIARLRGQRDRALADLELATTAEQACADAIEQNVTICAVLGHWVADKAVVDWRAIDQLLAEVEG